MVTEGVVEGWGALPRSVGTLQRIRLKTNRKYVLSFQGYQLLQFTLDK